MSQKRPLKIVIIDSPGLPSLVAALRDMGHEVIIVDPGDVDLFLGPICGRMTPELEPFVKVMIAEVQKGKYGSKRVLKAKLRSSKKG